MKSITVFCGAGIGKYPIYADTAKQLGATLASKNIEVVFGGGKIGLMGAVADGALQAGGKVTGVIPTFLKTKEVAHDALTTMHVVQTMHERKMKMHELCDGVIALPGGFGTFEELFEILTWGQLGLHKKPIGLLNVNGYYDHLIAMMEHMVKEELLSVNNHKMILISNNTNDLLKQMEEYNAPDVPEWMHKEEV
jgi:uncharacterized protein (TIGR00730 family)